MHSYKPTAIAAALLAFHMLPAAAQTNEELLRQLQDLRRQIDELRQQVQTQPAATPAPAAAPDAAAAVPDPTASALPPEQWPATQADLQGLRADLENYKYDQARQYERTTAKTTRNTTINGNLTASASWNNPGTTPASDTANRKWGFDTPSATINFQGVLFRDYSEGKNLTYLFGLTGSSSIAVQDAYIRYSFAPTNGGPDDPLLNLSFGQQQVPFGLEAQANTEIRPVIAGAQFLSAPGLGGANFGARQIGLVLRGDAGINVDRTTNYRSALFEYAAGILNGNGPNTADNNNRRDYVARAAFTVPADYNSLWRELKIGASYYKGYSNLTNNADPANTFVEANGRSDRYGIDVNYTRLPWSVAYERVEGRDDAYSVTTNAAPYTGTGDERTRKSVGQYLNVGYTVGEQFLASSRNQGKFDDYWPKTIQYFVRYDTYDADKDSARRGDKSYATTLGLNAYFAETTRFQVNYVLRRNDEPAAGYTANRPRNTNGVVARFVYGF